MQGQTNSAINKVSEWVTLLYLLRQYRRICTWIRKYTSLSNTFCIYESRFPVDTNEMSYVNLFIFASSINAVGGGNTPAIVGDISRGSPGCCGTFFFDTCGLITLFVWIIIAVKVRVGLDFSDIVQLYCWISFSQWSIHPAFGRTVSSHGGCNQSLQDCTGDSLLAAWRKFTNISNINFNADVLYWVIVGPCCWFKKVILSKHCGPWQNGLLPKQNHGIHFFLKLNLTLYFYGSKNVDKHGIATLVNSHQGKSRKCLLTWSLRGVTPGRPVLICWYDDDMTTLRMDATRTCPVRRLYLAGYRPSRNLI